MHIIGTLILLTCCNSMLQNKGNVRYESNYYNNINYGGMRYDNSDTNFIKSFTESQGLNNDYINYDLFNRFFFSIGDSLENKINGGDKKMDSDINTIITAITSAIAGIYCAVKTILNLVKKLKSK